MRLTASFKLVSSISSCPSLERLENADLALDAGIGALSGYLASRGLLLGIYSDSGSFTCQGFPGSRGHEAEDARSFAEWGEPTAGGACLLSIPAMSGEMGCSLAGDAAG